MKKILIRIGIGLLILLVLAVLAISLFLDGAVKRGIETYGPRLTKVDVKLDAVSLSLLSGSGKVKGLVVGNPEGYKTAQAIKMDAASVSLKPGSLLGSKLVITKIEVIAPDITFEGGFGGNNLGKIRSNLEESTGGNSTNAAPTENKPGKKMQVDEFVITGAKIHVSISGTGGKEVMVPIPDIHLSNLGQGPEGITAAELAKRVLAEIEQAAIKAASTAATSIGKDATELTKGLGKNLGNTVSNGTGSITKGIGDLFKKKPAQ